MWFKKDLRVWDHRPLLEAVRTASQSGREKGLVFALFVIEDKWLNSKEFDSCHYRFVQQSLEDLKTELMSRVGLRLEIIRGDAVQILSDLCQKRRVSAVFSHEETGSGWTYDRDRAVKVALRSLGVQWYEFPQFGVVRGLQNRDLWERKRTQIVQRPLFDAPLISARRDVRTNSEVQSERLAIPSLSDLHLPASEKKQAQKGGRKEALEVLESFFSERGLNYRGSVSSPLTAVDHCSRLSPYITWGCLSLSEVFVRLERERDKWLSEAKSAPSSSGNRWLQSLKAFESRLWWHCHFIQKLESEPELEFRNANQGFDGLRESQFREDLFQAWSDGQTGFPMIDAAMRFLRKTGWINFRMRAMLVSFASYQLWLDWRKTGVHLARQFVDFEPGIHWSQMQMQSGVTGINTIRIYSPEKQAREQDPSGHFIATECPELAALRPEDRAAPWLVPPGLLMMQNFKFGRDYPAPVVDPALSYKEARDRIFARLKDPSVRRHAMKVLIRHGSRAKGRRG